MRTPFKSVASCSRSRCASPFTPSSACRRARPSTDWICASSAAAHGGISPFRSGLKSRRLFAFEQLDYLVEDLPVQFLGVAQQLHGEGGADAEFLHVIATAR